MDFRKIIFPPLHKEGVKFVALFAGATLVAGLVSGLLFQIGIVLTIWCFYFFRDPDRTVPLAPGIAVSPADGVVCLIDKAAPPPELGEGNELRTRICVFMNVFNCHVNRVPVAGVIEKIAYHPGKFLNASLDKASEENERNSIVLLAENGSRFCVTQIAGLVARRILCEVRQGDRRNTGERFGIIRFGSRVDLYLPEGYEPQVFVGQSVTAGESVLAVTKNLAIPDLTAKIV